MGFDNGNWAWLAETQGRFYYMARQRCRPHPRLVRCGWARRWTSGRLGPSSSPRCVRRSSPAPAESLPFDVEPGALLNYADLSGPKGQSRHPRLRRGGQRSRPSTSATRCHSPTSASRSSSRTRIGGRRTPPRTSRASSAAARWSCAPRTRRSASPAPGAGRCSTPPRSLAVLEAASQADFEPLIPLGIQGPLRGRHLDASSAPWSAASPTRARAIRGASTCSTSRATASAGSPSTAGTGPSSRTSTPVTWTPTGRASRATKASRTATSRVRRPSSIRWWGSSTGRWPAVRRSTTTTTWRRLTYSRASGGSRRSPGAGGPTRLPTRCGRRSRCPAHLRSPRASRPASRRLGRASRGGPGSRPSSPSARSCSSSSSSR